MTSKPSRNAARTRTESSPRGSVRTPHKHKMELFAHAYLANGQNATQAAIHAGYSRKTAYESGSRLLKHPRVQAIISTAHNERITHLTCTSERILQELSRLAFVDPRKFYNADGTLKPIPELDDDTASAIAGFDHDTLYQYFGKGQRKEIGKTSKIKLTQRTQALELLGKYRKLFDTSNDANAGAHVPLQITVQLVKPTSKRVTNK